MTPHIRPPAVAREQVYSAVVQTDAAASGGMPSFAWTEAFDHALFGEDGE